MAGPQTVIADARRHRARYLEELKEFVRFPSISAEPARAPDLERCAGWLVRHLRSMGLTSARVIPTAGHPLVLATTRKVPGRRTLLVYGHYDVQPTDPLSEWWTPPFCPTVRAGALYGRGASDDKGQLFAHLKALESYLRAAGEMPVNLICLIEGEEEVGSPGLTRFLRAQGRRLGADAVVVSDMPMAGPGRPAITYAMRGALSLQLDVRGPARDLHSGLYGGAVHNPAQALAEIITGLHRPDGRVAVPGFYRDVRRWSARERAYMRRVGPNDGRLAANGKIRTAWGEPGFTLYERTTIRPALTVNGMAGGYQGPGAKAVIPARATAKLGLRLVPDQDPAGIERLIGRRIAALTPETVTASLRTEFAAEPVLVDRGAPAVRAAYAALERGFGTAPVFVRLGGTIPPVSTMQRELDAPIVLMGFALPDDGMHAPNERFHLDNFFRGIETVVWFLDALGSPAFSSRGPGPAAQPGEPP